MISFLRWRQRQLKQYNEIYRITCAFFVDILLRISNNIDMHLCVQQTMPRTPIHIEGNIIQNKHQNTQQQQQQQMYNFIEKNMTRT